jgi:GxxExxY protein
MEKIIYKNEVYEIVGICMEIHRILGYGFLEIVYKDAIELEFCRKQIPYSREKEYNIVYKGAILKHRFFSDFTLYDNIIVEIKANTEGIKEEILAQTLNYLKVSKSRLGVIINFGKSSLEYKRMIL